MVEENLPKVLIIDDSPINIKLLWDILKDDYEVSVATNGREGLEIAGGVFAPDVILLDILMPIMDGFEVCRQLKADIRTQNIPVIFITVKTREEDEAKGLALGAVDYITKPFSPAIVKARVRTHLELKRHRDRLEASVKKQTDALVRVNEQLQKDIAERKRAEARLRKARDEEIRILEMTTDLSFELNLGRLLMKIMDTTQQLLSADRCTLFLYDEKTDELWSQVAHGLDTQEIRIHSHSGIAGTVFITGETVNIADAYSDPRFNPEVDKQTGYRTQSILCMPIRNKNGKIIGVTQILNKRNGPFTQRDEKRLQAFSAQASIALENAKLFEQVLDMKNYNESIFESMSNGLISLDANKAIVTCNLSALQLFHRQLDEVAGLPASKFFQKHNSWILDGIDKVMETRSVDITMDADIILDNGTQIPVNLSIVPLLNVKKEFIGLLLVIEDITSEKRLKSTIARYMTREVAEKLIEEGETALGGQTQEATVLFSDIRGFTTISERLNPQETVSMLNSYFTRMVDVIFRYNGILDKYIGDAILAVFGAPFSMGNDPDRAVKAAIDMMLELEQFNDERISLDQDPITIGIGINTDEVLSGNIGSEKRMDYTVIGDGVNLASRLEGVNKVYGTHILISEFTYKQLRKTYYCREIDLIRVRGKITPVGIYEVLDYKTATSHIDYHEVLDLYREGLQFYRRRNWPKAMERFNQALSLDPTDSVSRTYLERCRYFKENPPAQNWDCVWVMESK